MTDADPSLEPETVERDPDTSDMFGGAPAPTPSAEAPAYQVLARKYRPRTFEDLIGQGAMVRTLTNAFATGRIAHAFMLTGVRGVGKTTTARLLARALNYQRDGVDHPSVDLSVEGIHCRSIIEGRHIDVMELDAASHTKVDEMRELLDGVRYAPVEARYKVYIIDEVHMLSTAAFNALLKTLEEPPPHAKFIFATTEIRKVPVTILSRCQRFDLRRVEPAVIVENLEAICRREGVQVEAEGLALIGRAAEGSVRDAQSLLDQALVQAEGGAVVSVDAVRDMLGLADRAATIGLFELVAQGKTGEALEAFRTLYGYGADPAVVLLDLLEHSHGASVARTLGPDALHLPKDQAARLAAVGAEASVGSLSRMWQMLLKAHEETRRAPDAFAAAEMALIRLCYAAELPGPEEALKMLQAGETPAAPAGAPGHVPSGGGGGASAARAHAAPAFAHRSNVRPAPQNEAQAALKTFNEVVALVESKRDVALKHDIDRFVRLIDYQPGRITFALADGAPANLAQRLTTRLKDWTGQFWGVSVEGGQAGQETAYERDRREREAVKAGAAADPFVQQLMGAFPGAEIVDVRDPPAPPPTVAVVENPDEVEDDGESE
jgi:DNA polymerase-3 subunit gamma/tau